MWKPRTVLSVVAAVAATTAAGFTTTAGAQTAPPGTPVGGCGPYLNAVSAAMEADRPNQKALWDAETANTALTAAIADKQWPKTLAALNEEADALLEEARTISTLQSTIFTTKLVWTVVSNPIFSPFGKLVVAEILFTAFGYTPYADEVSAEIKSQAAETSALSRDWAERTRRNRSAREKMAADIGVAAYFTPGQLSLEAVQRMAQEVSDRLPGLREQAAATGDAYSKARADAVTVGCVEPDRPAPPPPPGTGLLGDDDCYVGSPWPNCQGSNSETPDASPSAPPAPEPPSATAPEPPSPTAPAAPTLVPAAPTPSGPDTWPKSFAVMSADGQAAYQTSLRRADTALAGNPKAASALTKWFSIVWEHCAWHHTTTQNSDGRLHPLEDTSLVDQQNSRYNGGPAGRDAFVGAREVALAHLCPNG